MGKRTEFETLNGFASSLQDSRVVFKNSRVLLDEGLRIAVKMVKMAASNGKKVILVGNGGSSAIASHQVVDLTKNAGIRAICFSDPAWLTCLSNDYSYEQVYEKSVEMYADEGDIMIAISSSGKSANILNAVKAARAKQLSVLTFSGFDSDNPLSSLGDLNFYVPSPRYGIVEIGHLLLIHTVVDELVEAKKVEQTKTGNKNAVEAQA